MLGHWLFVIVYEFGLYVIKSRLGILNYENLHDIQGGPDWTTELDFAPFLRFVVSKSDMFLDVT